MRFLSGWQVVHPKEVTMKSYNRAWVLVALAALVLMAWAADNAAANRSRSDKDNKTAVVQGQQAKEDKRPDRATESQSREDQAPRSRDRDAQTPRSRPEENQSPKSRDRDAETPRDRSDAAQPSRSGNNAVQSSQPRPEATQAPAPPEQRNRTYAEPVQVQTGQEYNPPGEAGGINVPQPGGAPRPPRGGENPGGYRGGPGPTPFDRRPTHFFGGRGWHGPHDHWRYRRFHDSWRFLFYLGPVIYYPPIHYPYVIRIPHDRVGVYVRYTGDDAVGSAFANSVREQLRDEGLRVVYSQDDAKLELYIISMERDPDDPGYNSAISVSYIWYPGHKFITAQMVDAGLNEVDDLAASVAGYADDLVD